MMNIFIIDDDPMQRMITADLLESAGETIHDFDSGSAMLAAIDSIPPDIVLLDIEMPGLSGIETCQKLRSSGVADAQVIFVSGLDDLETRLTAYEAGGNDFISKSTLGPELLSKVLQAKETISRKRSLEEQAQFSRQVAFTAMSTSGEMGVVLSFMRNAFAAATAEDIAREMYLALEQYGLGGVVSLLTQSQWICIPNHEPISPLEASIVAHARSMERVFQFRDRIAINYPSVTVIVYQLPLDDPDRVGRLRDYLAILVEAADVRLKSIEAEARRLAQAAGITSTLAELTATLGRIEAHQREAKMHAMVIDNQYLAALEKAFIHLGLTDGQEAMLDEQANSFHAQRLALLDSDAPIHEEFKAVINSLAKLSN